MFLLEKKKIKGKTIDFQKDKKKKIKVTADLLLILVVHNRHSPLV